MGKINSGKMPEYFYDNASGAYWLHSDPGAFTERDARNLKLLMKFFEMNTETEDDYGLKAGDRALIICQQNRAVDYATAVAGHKAGIFHTHDGKKLLVTSEVSQPVAKRGEIPRWERFLDELLGPEQSTILLCWLKVARESLLEGDFRPGQMLCLAGPSGCGKSLLQSLITVIFGGRMAKPYQYMTGKTTFNVDIATAEHLVIADEQASVDIRSRRNFGAAVKDMIVNVEMRIHAKGKDAVAMAIPTFKRLSLSVNDEPENLMILPPLDESIMDKLLLFKCSVAWVGANRKRTWELMTKEIPALCYELDRLKIPKALLDDRMGVRSYHNPELFDMISAISPEQRLLTLIDEILKEKFPFEGTAEQLELDLRNSAFTFAVEKLLSFPSAAGTYLSRLAKKIPNRISSKIRSGKTIWFVDGGEK